MVVVLRELFSPRRDLIAFAMEDNRPKELPAPLMLPPPRPLPLLVLPPPPPPFP